MNLLVAPIFLPLAFALLGLLGPRSRGYQSIVGLLSAITLFAVTLTLLLRASDGTIYSLSLGSWAAPFGINLVADITSTIFLAVCSFTSLGVALYAVSHPIDKPLDRWLFPFMNLLIMGVNGSLLTGDIFNLFVWFEVMLISSFVLMVIGGRRPQLEGGLKYVIINLVASAVFLSGIGILYGKTGSLNMADIAMTINNSQHPEVLRSSVAMLLGAFAVKAGLFPLFFWLPASYHTPHPIVTALFAGLLTKVGVYAIIRVSSLFLAGDMENWQTLFLWVAALTMITGVLGAAAQFEMRKILAFHIISQVGYLIAGFAIYTVAGIAAGLFYFIHNNLAKTNLLLIAGWVQNRHGTGDLERVGGLYKAAPAISILFLISALALAGIPPLSGFWAKLGIVRAGLEGQFFWLTAAALAVGMMTLFSMIKIWAEVFWKADPEEKYDRVEHHQKPALHASLYPIGFMAGAILLLSFAGEPVYELSVRAAEQLLDSTQYINSVLPK